MEIFGSSFENNPDIPSVVAVQAIVGMGSPSTTPATGTAFGVGTQASNVDNTTGQPTKTAQQPSQTSKTEENLTKKPKNWWSQT